MFIAKHAGDIAAAALVILFATGFWAIISMGDVKRDERRAAASAACAEVPGRDYQGCRDRFYDELRGRRNR